MGFEILGLRGELVGALLGVWRRYQEFYEVGEIDEGQNRGFVENILANPGLGRIHVARQSGVVVGFSTIYFTFSSARACRVALLNDLFVEPEARGAGIGRALIEQALAFARAEGIPVVRWMTQAGNERAQRLYEAYGSPTLWKLYSVNPCRP